YGPAPLIRCQTEESADRWEEKLEKIWPKSYPPGVPAEIDINQYVSLREVLEESCAKFGSRPAYSCMGRTITFTELDRSSAAVVAILYARALNMLARSP